MEKYDKWSISDVSWRDGISQDPYYWLSNSFQYSENLNTDDELHWVKLSQKVESDSDCKNCQLVSAWDKVFALPLSWWTVKYFDSTNWTNPQNTSATIPTATWTNYSNIYGNWVIFQDYFWFWVSITLSNPSP